MPKPKNPAGRGPILTLINRLFSSPTPPPPKLPPPEVKKELVVVISTDKGLAGALNTNLFREAAKFGPTRRVYVVSGGKARQFLTRTRRELVADFQLKDAPAFAETKEIAKFCVEKFLSGEVDKVSVLFTHFINTINQKPVVRTLLPISSFELPQAPTEGATPQDSTDPMIGYLFEPTPEGVLDVMLPYYLHYQVFQMILDARASEHSARMVAMKNATDNAKQFIKDLTLEYNKMRQASITTELLEISTAQMAVGA